MHVEKQKTEELTQLGELIKDMSVCMLTTIDDEDAMVSRPMSPQEMSEDGAIWFLTDPNTTKVQHLRLMNLAFSNESDGTYVSISGHGEIVKDRVHIDGLWTVFARPWFPEGADSSNLALLKFVPHSAEYWDSPNSKMVRMLAMAVSIVAAKPVGMGEHGNLTTL
ncbi:MAG: pyridoxamine 5'-phosphate oxidase family protein [Pseudomonadota bacterium]